MVNRKPLHNCYHIMQTSTFKEHLKFRSFPRKHVILIGVYTRQGAVFFGQVAIFGQKQVIFGQKHLIFGQETIRAKPLDFWVTNFFFFCFAFQTLAACYVYYTNIVICGWYVVIEDLFCTRSKKKVHKPPPPPKKKKKKKKKEVGPDVRLG